MDLKPVLIITYRFPPRPGIGSLRLRGLAKYLPKFGWEPVILTAALPKAPDKQFQVIQTPYPGDVTALLKKKLHLDPDKGFQEQVGIPLAIREGKRSFTTKIITLIKELLAYPDEQKNWYPFAVETGTKVMREKKFKAIISSSGPVTSHLIAKELKRKFNIPWIADLRDLWTQNHYYPYGRIRKWFERRLELKTLNRADALVTVSKPLAEDLSTLHHRIPVFVIPNGFDPDEVGTEPLTKQFTITYTGQLYQGKQDPKLLLKAISELIAQKIIDRNNIEIRFFGPIQYWLEQAARKFNLNGIVKQYGTVPREVALKKQRESQILLLLNWNDPNERGVYTGKIFEYLAARRPILAIGGPKGVVSELLAETNSGFHTSNLEDLKTFITRCYKEYKEKGQVKYRGNVEKVNRYSHYEMAKKFNEVLEFAITKS